MEAVCPAADREIPCPRADSREGRQLRTEAASATTDTWGGGQNRGRAEADTAGLRFAPRPQAIKMPTVKLCVHDNTGPKQKLGSD